jgi:gas vesicle protein
MTARDYIWPALGVFGAGVAVGAGVALLIAPKSGARLRQDISDRASSLKHRVMPGNGVIKTDKLEAMTRDELYERAKGLAIDGRSEMSKGELIEAIRGN